MQISPDKSRLWQHYGATQSILGRWWLNRRTLVDRWVWRQVTASRQSVKRGFDLVASGLFLVLFSPLYLLIAALVKLEDGGPVIFRQTRVGQFGSEFIMFKFRSMGLDAESRLREVLGNNEHSEGVTFKIKNDPRVTRTGRWLRKFSFDELPQVYNVFKGDMSLVGPRPPLPREVARYSLADRRRLLVRPGITCFWQIGGRSEIDFFGTAETRRGLHRNPMFPGRHRNITQNVAAVLSGKGAC